MAGALHAIQKIHKSIFLVGFMASGKSTVGPALAEMLRLPFVDIDREIENNVGCSIGELIQQKGESHFRQLESAYLRNYADAEIAVIALGGGAFTITENRAVVAGKGISVWLDAPFDLCWERIRQDAAIRPLAANEEVAFERFASRRSIYQLAEHRIEIKRDETTEKIACQIIQLISASTV